MRMFSGIAFLCIAQLLAACSDDNRVHFEIRNLADKTTAPLTNMAVIVGDDKYAWPTLAGGETQSVNLWPNPDSGREVGLHFTQEGEQKGWGGLKLGSGKQGYRFILEIDADGHVTSRYCALPCSLDD